jgi:hypothetical protein
MCTVILPARGVLIHIDIRPPPCLVKLAAAVSRIASAQLSEVSVLPAARVQAVYAWRNIIEGSRIISYEQYQVQIQNTKRAAKMILSITEAFLT